MLTVVTLHAAYIRDQGQAVRKHSLHAELAEPRALCQLFKLRSRKPPQHRDRPIIARQKAGCEKRTRHATEIIRHKISHKIIHDYSAAGNPGKIRKQPNDIFISEMM